METVPLITLAISVGIILFLSFFVLVPFMRRLQQFKSLSRYINNERELRALHTRLELLMLEHRPFLNAGFNEDALARELGIPAALLECFLKAYLETSFLHMVDTYRVQYACLMMQSETATELPMDTIAHASGFASRQNFYQSFRRHTGKTPVQYLKYLVFTRTHLQVA